MSGKAQAVDFAVELALYAEEAGTEAEVVEYLSDWSPGTIEQVNDMMRDTGGAGRASHALRP